MLYNVSEEVLKVQNEESVSLCHISLCGFYSTYLLFYLESRSRGISYMR